MIFPSRRNHEIKNRLINAARTGFRRGIGVFAQLCGIMIPVYIVVAVLKQTPLFGFLSELFSPLMRHLGLPGESALAIVTGNIVNLYAAAAVAVDLNLTVRQMTIMALMLGISHSQIMETAIVRKMRGRPVIVTSLRLIFSVIAGFALNQVWPS